VVGVEVAVAVEVAVVEVAEQKVECNGRHYLIISIQQRVECHCEWVTRTFFGVFSTVSARKREELL
jgi:hypothetical protein